MSIHSRLSRFLFGFSHADVPLTDAQRARYNARVQALSSHDRRGQLAALLPGVASLAAIPLWIRLQKLVPLPWQVAVQVLFALAVIGWVLWLMRWKHRRHGSRALRELGLADVCSECGYDLSRHPGPEGRCPECGEAFSQFHPDRTWSTDQP